jgi:hypothetical protein
MALMGFGFVVARFGLFLREMSIVQGAPVTPGQLADDVGRPHSASSRAMAHRSHRTSSVSSPHLLSIDHAMTE